MKLIQNNLQYYCNEDISITKGLQHSFGVGILDYLQYISTNIVQAIM